MLIVVRNNTVAMRTWTVAKELGKFQWKWSNNTAKQPQISPQRGENNNAREIQGKYD